MEKTEKKPYEAPELVTMGNVASVTKTKKSDCKTGSGTVSFSGGDDNERGDD